MPSPTHQRHVVVLAPMPLEMDAIVRAFALAPIADGPLSPHTGMVGGSSVTAVHIGMGPPLRAQALVRILDDDAPAYGPVDHVMIAGICGGLDPEVPVGTLINAEVIVEHARAPPTSTVRPATRPGPASWSRPRRPPSTTI